MTGDSYRVPCKPVEPGEKVLMRGMCIIEHAGESVDASPKGGAILDKGPNPGVALGMPGPGMSVKRMG